MPYYVFRVGPVAMITRLAEFDTFRGASMHAKALRAELVATSGQQIKLMFAETEDAALDLLCQPRTAGPAGDD